MGFFDSLFGKKATPVATSGVGTLPQYAQTGYENLFNTLSSLSPDAFAPAGLNTTQNSALASLTNRPPVGGFQFGKQANQAFGQASDIFGQIPGQIDLANQNVASGVNPITGEEISTNIGYFLNPFTGQVVDSTTRNIREQGAGLMSDIASQASNAGAFGGTRQAISESELNKNILQTIGDTTGNLYNTGFQSAASNALNKLQNERSNFLTGAGINTQGANALTGAGSALSSLGGNLMDARKTVDDIRRSQGLDALAAGTVQQDQATAEKQGQLSQLAAIQSLLEGLARTSGTSLRENPGALQRISNATAPIVDAIIPG